MASRTRATNDATHRLLGAHMSIAGGYHLALEEAARHRSGAVQLFTRNSNQWVARPISGEEVRRFRETDARLGPFEMAAHDSYLINLGSPDRALREKSRRAFVGEIERCELLGIPRLVFHPGAHTGAGERAGLKLVAGSVRAALRATRGFRTRVLFENTAGQGTVLGHRLEQLEQLLAETGEEDRVGVCLDTCHLFAAGYDFRDAETYGALRAEIERRIGLHRIGWFHLNDCKRELGSRVDRHTHIGRGRLGSRAFRFFLQDPAFRSTPMVLETPKEDGADRRNLALLRRLSRIAPA
jgi:deoxyribonuclease-4